MAIPRMIAPAFLSRLTTPASSGTTDPKRLKDPAVVFIPEEALKFPKTPGEQIGSPSDARVPILSYILAFKS